MRSQFVKTVERLMDSNDRIVLLLGDIGVHAFRNCFSKFPTRTYNLGICEQSIIGMAAGLATKGFIPIVHSIAPFIVERCFEQIKLDCGYQMLPVKIVSVGASYDYSSLGCTHHCPGDVALLKTIPEMEIYVPGSGFEFDELFTAAITNPNPCYFRLSEQAHGRNLNGSALNPTTVRFGKTGSVICFGPMLSSAMEATEGMDVSLIYSPIASPFRNLILPVLQIPLQIVTIEPFYSGTMAFDVQQIHPGIAKRVLSIGVPKTFIRSYGTLNQLDDICEITPEHIRRRISEFLGL